MRMYLIQTADGNFRKQNDCLIMWNSRARANSVCRKGDSVVAMRLLLNQSTTSDNVWKVTN